MGNEFRPGWLNQSSSILLLFLRRCNATHTQYDHSRNIYIHTLTALYDNLFLLIACQQGVSRSSTVVCSSCIVKSNTPNVFVVPSYDTTLAGKCDCIHVYTVLYSILQYVPFNPRKRDWASGERRGREAHGFTNITLIVTFTFTFTFLFVVVFLFVFIFIFLFMFVVVYIKKKTPTNERTDPNPILVVVRVVTGGVDIWFDVGNIHLMSVLF